MILIMVSLLTITPYLWALSTSLKVRTDVFTPVPQWIPSRIVTTNYKEVFSMAPFGRYLVNTIIVVTGVLLVQELLITSSAFVFARMNFPGSRFFFALYLIQMMLPVHAIIVPNYLTIRRLGLLDTRLAMMLPFFASGYGTFLVRQAFKQVPKEFEEAAIVDGCPPLRFLWQILVPLAKPTLVAHALISVVTHWNDFYWPLVVTDSPAVRTLTIGLAMFVQQESGADWTLLMAATVFVTAPLMITFLIFQRKFVESFMSAGIKG
jgi:sn-glycerol 3-phosphate transport system permease protein